ncbi:hypothetical protein PV11_00359 [Exophiala sideris]|uniref:CMP/dCMP-type deaminase domain-containing protein n=1 Tax=Exophiala sideris TaxID=1016849 RepID=A0A0D1X9S6_9EURO|nr:hypothetical protein PV11_00359 [Exophiala sideris]
MSTSDEGYRIAVQEALGGLEEGGIPVGGAIIRRNSSVRKRRALAADGVQERNDLYDTVAVSDVRRGDVVLQGEKGGDSGQ